MSDPITALLVKVAATSTAGTVAVAWGARTLVQATDATDGWVLTGGGVAGIIVLIWKLISDHTTVDRERSSTDQTIDALRADLAAARALTRAAVADARLVERIAEDIWLEAVRGGMILDGVQARRQRYVAAHPDMPSGK